MFNTNLFEDEVVRAWQSKCIPYPPYRCQDAYRHSNHNILRPNVHPTGIYSSTDKRCSLSRESLHSTPQSFLLLEARSFLMCLLLHHTRVLISTMNPPYKMLRRSSTQNDWKIQLKIHLVLSKTDFRQAVKRKLFVIIFFASHAHEKF